jgi:hypothetical protein
MAVSQRIGRRVQFAGTATVSCTSNNPGDYVVTLTATAGSISRQATITVHVVRASATSTTFSLPFLSIPVLLVEYIAGGIATLAIAGILAVILLARKKGNP